MVIYRYLRLAIVVTCCCVFDGVEAVAGVVDESGRPYVALACVYIPYGWRPRASHDYRMLCRTNRIVLYFG